MISPSLRPQPNDGHTWKHGPVPVIGLVGLVGSGKSRVSAEFGRLGARVIEADLVGHEVLLDPAIRDAVVARFGDGVLDGVSDRPRIDRKALGRIVFADPEALKALEAIVHPPMRQRFERTIAAAESDGLSPLVVLEAAILYEKGWEDLCDRVVLVDASQQVRLARVAASRGWDAATLEARDRAQAPIESKRSRVDATLDNDHDDPDRLAAAVEAIRQSLTGPADPSSLRPPPFAVTLPS